MFDSLKDKLGRFREDAEEEAEAAETEETEEPAETVDETGGEKPPAGSRTDADSTQGTTEPAASVEPDAEPEPAGSGEPIEPAGSGEPIEPDVSPDADSDSATRAEPSETRVEADEQTSESRTESEEGGDSSSGFMHRARSLATGKIVIDPEVIEGPLDDLEIALLESDVELTVANEIIEGVRDELENATRGMRQTVDDVIENALREALLDVIAVGQFDFDQRIAEAEKPVTLIFTGVNGVGKTTTIAKLSQYLEKRGYSTVIANGDTYRAGANEQIREHADALGTKLISHQQGGDPAAVIYDAVEYAEAHDVDVVLGDTAGRLHTNEGLMDQLEKIDRVVGPDMTLFVDEAVAGQDAVQRAKKFNDAAEIDGAVLTKADADANGGAAISIAYVTGKPILFLGTGQGYDDIERFDPERLADQLVGAE
ncbi:signal recognition particle-docking protein FtsY [Halalkalicoccus ordinarius]|uniref:signal recognition particle-docking protein FtsY n=1 Tax=Halalkalicoccus ordinarius TaxID=3116651 RepID=UPI00300ED920